MANLESFQLLLNKMRNEFLAEIPERCDTLDELTVQFEKSPDDESLFNELFRQVHSLKGSGGTHGLGIITTLCHQFENLLSYSKANKIFNQSQASIALSYIDLLRKIAVISTEMSNPDFTGIESEVYRLTNLHIQQKKSGLIIEGSQMMSSLYLQALDNLSIQLSVNSNGLEALARLIREPFDFVIIGRELKELNGIAMLAALRHSQSRNQNIPAILVSSNPKEDLQQLSISAIVSKDQALAKNLLTAVNNIIT